MTRGVSDPGFALPLNYFQSPRVWGHENPWESKGLRTDGRAPKHCEIKRGTDGEKGKEGEGKGKAKSRCT